MWLPKGCSRRSRGPNSLPHCAIPAMHCAHTVVSHEACGDLDPSVCQIYNPNKPSYCFMNKGKQCDRAYAANGEVEDTPHPSHYHPKTRLTQPEAPKVSIPRPHTAQNRLKMDRPDGSPGPAFDHEKKKKNLEMGWMERMAQGVCEGARGALATTPPR